MISKLPRWIEIGALVLAFNAGCINAIGLLGFEHQAVSHVSGTVTLLGASMLEDTFTSSMHLAGVLLSFFLGAAMSGFILHGSTLKLGRNYEAALVLEAALIFSALYFLSQGSYYGHYTASAACGLQNALATTYSGAVVRTTHLTGIFTDLGIMLGAVLRGKTFIKRKATLFLIIATGFIVGGTVGAVIFKRFQFEALWLPACVCLLLAAIYRVYAQKHS